MFPKDDPKIIIYGVAKRSSTSNPLSKAVKEIITNVSKYYNIYDEKTTGDKKSSISIDNYSNKNISNIKTELEEKGLIPIILGDGNQVINQYPNNNVKLIKEDKVFLLTNSSNIKMPNIINYSKSEVIALTNLLNINYSLNGNGYVIKQSIKEGENVNSDMKLEVDLKLLYAS